MFTVLKPFASSGLLCLFMLGCTPSERSAGPDIPENPSDAWILERFNITPDQLVRLHRERAVSNRDIPRMPVAKLKRALWRLDNPKPDHPGEAAEFRLLHLRDENQKIPHGALTKAWQAKRAMPFDPEPWAPLKKPVGKETAQDGSGDIQPLTAGIQPSSWTEIGPGNIGGRVRSILIHPSTPDTLWTASVGGGIWKSTDAGASWTALDDFMANLAVSTMVMDPTDPDTIYAGTGEGFYNVDAIRGAGIFKTTDGGTTWQQLSSTTSSTYYYVNRLAIHPTNGQILLAATRNGIYRSTNGGGSWSQQYSGEALDVDFDPNDGNKAIAGRRAGVALYSTDGGASWTAATGLPSLSGFDGRVEVAYAPSSSSTVFASVDDNSGEVYRSTDGGQSYAQRNTGNNYLGGQGWYDNIVWVDPTNPDIVIVGGIDLWRSTDGGATLTKISQWFSAPASAHADHHAIVAHPGFNGTSNRIVYFGNDGGVYRANNVYTVAGTSGWQELNNNLGITQFYGAAGNSNSLTVVGGTQDNGTLRYTSAGGSEGWTEMFGGDGGWCAADPTDPNYFYGEYVYLQIHRSSNGGASSSYIFSGIGDAGNSATASFIAPFILDPNNPNTLLAGGVSLWRSTNVKAGTPSWSAIKSSTGSKISAIAVAEGNSDVVWVGHEDGGVYYTSNGTGASPTWTRVDTGSPNLPNRYCTRITIDRSNHNRAYATFGGFSAGNVWRTTDSGANWSNIASGLPSVPVRSLVIAPFDPSYLYIGTEVGIFASADGGSNWSPGNEGPSNVSVDELFWMGDYLVAATHGRGLFRALVSGSPAIQIVDTMLVAEGCSPSNSVPDPDEVVTVSLTLTNASLTGSSSLVATLQTSGGVSNPSAAQAYGALVAGGAAVSRSFTFTATGNCGGTLTATWQLQDGPTDLGTVSEDFSLGVPLTPIEEAFDGVTAPAVPAGWSTSASGSQANWITVASGFDSSPNAAFSAEAAATGDAQLATPSVPIATATAELSFRNFYDTEFSYDGGVLEISFNGGAFSDIESAGGTFSEGGYVTTISSDFGSPIAGRSAWTGNSGGYIDTVVQLPASAAGKNVRFRWRCATDSSVGGNGWHIDGVVLRDGYDCCTGTGGDRVLVIRSDYGTASPPVGSNDIAVGSSVTAAILDSPVTVENAQQRAVLVVTGWVGTGSAPASGSSTNTGSFVITEDSSIEWLWAIQDLFVSNQMVNVTNLYEALKTITAGDGFVVKPSGDVTLDAGEAVRLKPGFKAEDGSKFRAVTDP